MISQNKLQHIFIITALSALLLQGCSSIPRPPESINSNATSTTSHFSSEWENFEDRIWLGNDMWATDIASWQIKSGKLLCKTTANNLHQLTLIRRKVTSDNKHFSMSITFDNRESQYGVAGFLLGISSIDLKNIEGKNIDSPGLFAGITQSGELVLQTSPTANRLHEELKSNSLSHSQTPKSSLDSTKIMLTAVPVGNRYTILLQYFDTEKSVEIARKTLWNVPASLIHGHPGLACLSPAQASPTPQNLPLSIMLDKWTAKGMSTVIEDDSESNIGPIIGAWHTLHKNTLRMNVQLMPVGKRLNIVKLQIISDEKWGTIAQSDIRSTDFSTAFTINNWDLIQDQPYRLEYGESLSDGSIRTHYWSGTIAAANEADTKVITIAEPLAHPHTHTLATLPNIYIFPPPSPPPHTHQNLTKLQEWYCWCFANREVGRNTCCLGIYNQSMTYRRVRVEIAKSAAPQEQTPEDDWQSWRDADMRLIYAPDMYQLVATRDDPENLSTENIADNQAIYSASSGIGYIEVNPATRSIIYNRITTEPDSTTKLGAPLPGWPITCMHNMAYDREHVGYLPAVEITGQSNAVIQVINENSGKLLYSLRSSGAAFLPRVFCIGHYTMNIGNPETSTKQSFPNLTPRAPGETPPIKVTL